MSSSRWIAAPRARMRKTEFATRIIIHHTEVGGKHQRRPPSEVYNRSLQCKDAQSKKPIPTPESSIDGLRFCVQSLFPTANRVKIGSVSNLQTGLTRGAPRAETTWGSCPSTVNTMRIRNAMAHSQNEKTPQYTVDLLRNFVWQVYIGNSNFAYIHILNYEYPWSLIYILTDYTELAQVWAEPILQTVLLVGDITVHIKLSSYVQRP